MAPLQDGRALRHQPLGVAAARLSAAIGALLILGLAAAPVMGQDAEFGEFDVDGIETIDMSPEDPTGFSARSACVESVLL